MLVYAVVFLVGWLRPQYALWPTQPAMWQTFDLLSCPATV